MEIDYKKELQSIGLSENEAAVYVSLIKLGSANNAQIARNSGLNRITNFEVLKRLVGKGLVSGFKMKGTTYFGALNPQILIKQRRENLSILEKGLSELVLNKSNQKKPKITTYGGKEGLKQIYEQSLLSKSEILTFTNPDDIRGYFGNEYVDGYVRNRVRKGISVRGFAPDDELGEKEKVLGEEVSRQTKLFDTKFKIQNEVMIFDDTIALFSIKDEMGVVIKNESISKTLKSVWEMLWEKYEIK